MAFILRVFGGFLGQWARLPPRRQDGTRLVTSGDDGTVRIYALPIEQVTALARGRLTRTWTPYECRQFLRRPEDQCRQAYASEQ